MEAVFDEPVYRQVLPGAGDPLYLDRSLAAPVNHALFRPTKSDLDGLSMLRSKHRSQVWSGQRPGQEGKCFCLINLESRKLSEIAESCDLGPLTFDVVPDEFDDRFGEPYAHCVAREINYKAYNASKLAKMRFKNWAIAVASSVTIDLVVGPFHKPTDLDPYRP